LILEVIRFGESLILTKKLQNKYEERGVTKDILIYKEYKEYEVIDPLIRSVSVSGINGRVLYLTNDNILK
jgi:hypothetical protein